METSTEPTCNHIWGEPDATGTTYCYNCAEKRVIEGFTGLPDGISMDHGDVKVLVDSQNMD